MAGKSTYAADAVLNGLYRNTGLLAQTGSVYLGLKTADPTDDNSGGTEPTIGTNGYARIAVSRATGSWDAPTTPSAGTRRIANTGALSFPASTGPWASSAALTHVIVMDAATGGNMLHSGPAAVSRIVDGSGITLTFAAGSITIDES